ncbi:MAG TPA: CAP domain-containing protein [Pirellulales bacterium]|nr:CAP domain-containing protein [Pirellulales bacterium]
MLTESLILAAALGFAAETAKPESASTSEEAVTTKAPEKAKAGTVELFPAEKEIIQRTNAERKRHGLPPLVVDASLTKTARKHAYWMASSHTLQHASGDWAENIAQGQTTPAHAVSSWMSSSGHRANILNRRHRRIGVAGYRSARGDVFWCQQFKE